jgi:hypothetical protein
MRRIVTVVLALGVLAGCGDDGGDTAGEPADEVETVPVELGDGDEVWLEVETGGGFVPAIFNLREVPDVLLFDDGRLVRHAGDGDEVVPTFEAALLDEDDVAGLLAEAEAVLGGPDPGTPNVTDLPTTSIVLTTDGDERRLDVYALGFEDDAGLTDEEEQAREAASALLDDLATIGHGEPFVPAEWLALTTATLEGADVTSTVPWPLEPGRAADADTPALCTRVTGEDVDALLGALEGDDLGYVDTGETVVEIALRPVLTGDESCSDPDLEEFEQFLDR